MTIIDHARERVEQIDKKIQKNNLSIRQPMTLSELLDKEFPEMMWLIKDLIPAQSIIAFSGAPATFKSWLLLQMSSCIAEGKSLFEKFEIQKGAVLLVDEENNESILSKRLKLLQVSKDLPMHFFVLTNFKLTEESVLELVDLIKVHGYKLVIFDSLVRIHGGDENAARDMSALYSLFKEITKTGASVLFTHHNRKSGPFKSSSQDMRGSSDILAGVDCHLAVDKDGDILTITQTKLRQAQELGSFQVKIISDQKGFSFEYLGNLEQGKSKREKLKDGILELLTDTTEPLYQQQIYEQIQKIGMHVGRTTFKSVMDELEQLGHITARKGERTKLLYTLSNEVNKNEELVGQNISLI